MLRISDKGVSVYIGGLVSAITTDGNDASSDLRLPIENEIFPKTWERWD